MQIQANIANSPTLLPQEELPFDFDSKIAAWKYRVDIPEPLSLEAYLVDNFMTSIGKHITLYCHNQAHIPPNRCFFITIRAIFENSLYSKCPLKFTREVHYNSNPSTPEELLKKIIEIANRRFILQLCIDILKLDPFRATPFMKNLIKLYVVNESTCNSISENKEPIQNLIFGLKVTTEVKEAALFCLFAKTNHFEPIPEAIGKSTLHSNTLQVTKNPSPILTKTLNTSGNLSFVFRKQEINYEVLNEYKKNPDAFIEKCKKEHKILEGQCEGAKIRQKYNIAQCSKIEYLPLNINDQSDNGPPKTLAEHLYNTSWY